MSDLLPFVTAILRDRTVIDLSQQIQELKSKIKEHEDERLLVQITGSYGTPVYYQGSLKNGEPRNDDNDWAVAFSEEKDNDNNNSTALSVDLIVGSEIWLGGTRMECICAQNMTTYRVQHGTNGSRGWLIYTGRLGIFAVIGPATATEHTTLPGPTGRRDLTTLPDPFHGKIKDLIIKEVLFKKNAIRGSISLLESLGISTSLTTTVTPFGDINDNDNDDNDNDDENEN